jgi:hypothetical protein
VAENGAGEVGNNCSRDNRNEVDLSWVAGSRREDKNVEKRTDAAWGVGKLHQGFWVAVKCLIHKVYKRRSWFRRNAQPRTHAYVMSAVPFTRDMPDTSGSEARSNRGGQK